MKATLLIELRTEELPPKSLAKLGLSFREQMQKALGDAGFIEPGNAGKWFATPRRLALQFDDCLENQPDRVIEKKGPAVSAGVGADGTATKALEGFMRAAGVSFAQLERQNDPGGKSGAEYFVARISKKGGRIDETLAAMVDAALKKLPVAKLMRWGASEAQFVRPVQGLMMLHGARVVPGTVLELQSGNVTRGHRFLSAGDIVVPSADDYETVLDAQGHVIASFDARRAMIVEQLDRAAGQLTWLRDEALLDEVTSLVEFPAVYEASFEAEFLAVPQECLILTMKANQKYFPLMDAGDRLTNRFLVVSNMKVADPTNIITGNARVVRPRLADAKFFFETDKKTPLSARIGKLSRVVYHNKLGSQGERVDRLVKLAARIAQRLGADVPQAERAALLAKADLVTDMVGEFPELQGIMGRYYALADGEPAAVADAIEDHYKPRYSCDRLPRGIVGTTVALTDKLDTLTGLFGIGQIPTGDKDPFALRRHALGIVRILVENDLDVSLHDLISDSFAVFPPGSIGQAHTDLSGFVLDRFAGYLREQGYSSQEVEAVMALNPMRLSLVPRQLAAVRAFATLPEASSLAAANKRVTNILKKAGGQVASRVDATLLVEPAEAALNEALGRVKQNADSAFASGDYTASLQALASLKEPVDRFFDDVMVNVEDGALRANRLGLLATLRDAMNRVADISRLSV